MQALLQKVMPVLLKFKNTHIVHLVGQQQKQLQVQVQVQAQSFQQLSLNLQSQLKSQESNMDPITWATALGVLQKYWWVLLLIAVAIYVQILRTGIESRDKVINQQIETITSKNAEIKDLKAKTEAQNKAVDDMAQKGKEQAARLDTAIKRVNDMKPATQVIIREIYTDKTKDANQLLLNALSD